MEKSIGDRLRARREAAGLDLETLAGRAGVGADYLEWVEAGQVDPPVAFLVSVAQALGLTSSHFLRGESPSGREFQEQAKRTAHYSYQFLGAEGVDEGLMPFSITISPGEEHSGVGYEHRGSEFVFVIRGQAVLTVDGEVFTLTKGQSHHFDSERSHHLANPGAEEAELLVVLHVP